MRETIAAAEVIAVPTDGDSLEEVASMAKDRLNAFLREKGLGPEDVLAFSMTPYAGSVYVTDDGGGARDYTRRDPGLLLALVYKGRPGRR